MTVSGKPEVPTYWPGNVMLDGDNVRVGAGVVTPVRLTVCGLPGALSPMLRAAFRVPCAVGVKVTLTWQEALTARVAPQLLLSL